TVWDKAARDSGTVATNSLSLMLLTVYYLWQGWRWSNERAVYLALFALASFYAYLRVTLVAENAEWSGAFAVTVNFAIYAAARHAARLELAVFERPLRHGSLIIPLVLLLFELRYLDVNRPMGSIVMLLASGAFYTTASLDASWRNLQYLAALFYNLGLFLAWYQVNSSGLQGYLTIVGATLLWIVQMNRDTLDRALASNLRLAGALLLVAGPFVKLLQTSSDTLALLNLGFWSALVGTAGVVLKIRIFLYSGGLFFLLDLAALVWLLYRSSGWMMIGFYVLLLGVLAIGVAALFERKRSAIESRIQELQEEMKSWE
ncbi:MAG: hypothetical protein HY815_22590, partial [Candidatus Riflebacteria bacterium]|nr:hypothetical protein [Candidatus Riflebacteria bacterium]